MATSTITLYKVDIVPSMNAKIDDIETYLSNISASDKQEFTNMQYQKIEIIMNVKFPLNQIYGSKVKYNYAKVVNSDNTTHPFYFFITDTTNISESVVKLQLSMDSVNSIWNDVSTLWNNKTLITRRHKDRFIQKNIIASRDNILYRKVDNIQEGFGVSPNIRISSPTTIHQNSSDTHLDMKWYLVYKCEYSLASEEPNNPLHCYLYPEQSNLLFHIQGSSSPTITASDLQDGWYYIIRYKTGNTGTITIGGTTKTLDNDEYNRCVFCKSGNTLILTYYDRQSQYTYSYGGSYIRFTAPIQSVYKTSRENINWQENSEWDAIEAENNRFYIRFTGNYYVYGIETLDRTDSTIAKVIELPYAPTLITYDTVNNRYNIDQSKFMFDGERLALISLSKELSSGIIDNNLIQTEMKETLTAVESDNLYAVNHNMKFESKLYNSEFYEKKYIYDSFEKEVLLERFTYYQNDDTDITFNCIFKPSNNISSRFLFKFYTTNGTYDEIGNYTEYLNVDRNNEMSLFNNEYIQYLRSGYNYDKKKIQKEFNQAGLTSAIGFAGAVASATIPGNILSITSIASALNTGLNNLYNYNVANADLEQKLHQLKYGTSSINGADDLNLLNYYNGNRLQVCSYTLNDIVKDEVYNMLRLNGYMEHTYAIPSFNTRIWYDYLQCKPQFNKGFEYDNVILDDFKSRLEVGITIFHHTNNTWNFTQDKENFEVWMIN